MLKFHIHRILVCAKGFTFTTLKWNPIVQLQFLKFEFCTTSRSFVVPYLINNCGFSQENALKASLRLRFRGPQKPDSVLSFFRSHGFSNSQICHILQKAPRLLLCNTQKTLLPKFQYLLSKGVSSLDIVRMVTPAPRFLERSLENHIIPTCEFVRGFLQSDKRMIHLLIRSPKLLNESSVTPNIKLLLDNGVTHSSIALLLQRRNQLLWSANLLKTVEELKQMGFDPSTSTFSMALLAKRTVGKTKWAEKIDTFKKWGWSQEQVLLAFRRQPQCMLSSRDKINAVMSFWVEQVGFNSAEIVKAPGIFLFSLQKRIAPRALVVQFLISKSLLQKEASLTTPFILPEKLFLKKYVKHFKEDSSHLLKLYEEKMSLENDRGNPCSILRPSILCSELRNVVEELKPLGFDPFKLSFAMVLQAKSAVSNSLWDAKVDTFKRWDWSEDEVFIAFRNQPNVMLLEKRVVLRGLVVQHLLSNGLIKKSSSLVTLFSKSDKVFLQKYVRCFWDRELTSIQNRTDEISEMLVWPRETWKFI
ncbi:Transcription termination factor MTERF4, chloroplastic [Glycine max]|nr:Transcription termination factor MTERF4, chloroplastic [Glycine max]